MHEMSLVQSLLDIVRQEIRAHELTRLKTVRVTCGRLSGAVPDALHMAFTALTRDTALDGASLDLEIVPVKLQCGQCGKNFSPQDHGLLAAFAPCPACGQEIGHRVVSGQELNIEYIEAE
ncbi:MAG: hydrogenase maturation nickel metallochaperone HypA [Desulfovermiculus sp.]